MNLTNSQRRAVEHAGRNLQLIACAGSGKTEVVARRVVHLLTPGRPDSLRPANIIAFAFTEKAAAELKERIVTRTRQALGDLPGLAERFVGTIHAFCLELLKSESPEHLKYEVLNEVQQGLFVDRNSRRSGLTTSTDIKGVTLQRYKDTPRYVAALSILREAERVDNELDGCSVLAGLAAYQDLLPEKSYLDYSSILDDAVALLTNDNGLRARLAERVKYVIVDGYQDVNPVQEAIVWSLHELGARICVVGDDDQTIYQWRGSNVGNILTFDQRYPAVEQIPLEENFRSSQGIVETARAFIEQNTARLSKAMKPAGAQITESGDIVALVFTGPNTEAQHIVESIQGLRGVAFAEDGVERGLSWSDMAILLRSVKANAEPITRALQAASIPFVVTGMANLFSTAEAGAARQLFYFMADRPGVDAAALRNAWQAAGLGLDPATLDRALTEVTQAKAVLTDPDQKRWGQYSIQRVFLDFLEQAGLREELVPGGRGEVVFYNLGKFSQVITDFETIHQAKGMQWPVVFVPALLRNRFPAKKPGGRNVWHLLPRAGIKDQPRFEGTIEDERRLFYVAMTRSQKQIEISLGDGVTVNGRIDLVRRLDTGETTIVDLKSSDRAQAEEVTEAQLHVYALGYRDLTGRRPDYVEVYELDEGKRKPRSVDDDFITDVKQKVRDAAAALRTNTLPAAPVPKKCRTCDYGGMCTAGRSACAAGGGSSR